MKRWSSLQRELYQIVDEKIDFQIHLSMYRMQSQYGGTDMPRYWITLGDEIIFDYPKQFVDHNDPSRFWGFGGGCIKNLKGKKRYYPYTTDISEISDLIREYFDTPKEEILSKHFENDNWGLANILRVADKRIGKRRLDLLRRKTDNKAALKIIKCRLENREAQ